MRLKLELGDYDACLAACDAHEPRQRLLKISAMASSLPSNRRCRPQATAAAPRLAQ